MRLLQLFNTMQLSKNTPPKRKNVWCKMAIPFWNGGRDRSRTCDLVLIRDAL